MLAQYTEETGILVVLKGLEIGSQWSCLATREAQLTTLLRIGAQIDLCKMDMVDYRSILGDGSVDVFLGRAVDVVVALHADTIDGDTCVLHLFHHVVDAVALAGVGSVVIVVEEQGLGIGLVGKLKGLGDKFVAAEFEKSAFAVRVGFLSRAGESLVGHRLIDNIPCVNNVFVARNNGLDMLSEASVEHFLLHRFTLFVFEHPVGNLVVPAEVVTAQPDAILATAVSNFVGILPVELS